MRWIHKTCRKQMRWREKVFWWKIYENELGDKIPYTLCIPQPQPFYNFFWGGEGIFGPYLIWPNQKFSSFFFSNLSWSKLSWCNEKCVPPLQGCSSFVDIPRYHNHLTHQALNNLCKRVLASATSTELNRDLKINSPRWSRNHGKDPENDS